MTNGTWQGTNNRMIRLMRVSSIGAAALIVIIGFATFKPTGPDATFDRRLYFTVMCVAALGVLMLLTQLKRLERQSTLTIDDDGASWKTKPVTSRIAFADVVSGQLTGSGMVKFNLRKGTPRDGALETFDLMSFDIEQQQQILTCLRKHIKWKDVSPTSLF